MIPPSASRSDTVPSEAASTSRVTIDMGGSLTGEGSRCSDAVGSSFSRAEIRIPPLRETGAASGTSFAPARVGCTVGGNMPKRGSAKRCSNASEGRRPE